MGCMAKYITTTPKTKKIHMSSFYFEESPDLEDVWSWTLEVERRWLQSILTSVGVSCFASCLNFVWIIGTFWPEATLWFFRDYYWSILAVDQRRIVGTMSSIFGKGFACSSFASSLTSSLTDSLADSLAFGLTSSATLTVAWSRSGSCDCVGFEGVFSALVFLGLSGDLATLQFLFSLIALSRATLVLSIQTSKSSQQSSEKKVLSSCLNLFSFLNASTIWLTSMVYSPISKSCSFQFWINLSVNSCFLSLLKFGRQKFSLHEETLITGTPFATLKFAQMGNLFSSNFC